MERSVRDRAPLATGAQHINQPDDDFRKGDRRFAAAPAWLAVSRARSEPIPRPSKRWDSEACGDRRDGGSRSSTSEISRGSGPNLIKSRPIPTIQDVFGLTLSGWPYFSPFVCYDGVLETSKYRQVI